MIQVIRILVVDDHAIVREGLRALISGKPDMELVGEAGDGQESLLQARSLQPDVILMDGQLSGEMNGVQAAVAIRREIARIEKGDVLFVLSNRLQQLEVLRAGKSAHRHQRELRRDAGPVRQAPGAPPRRDAAGRHRGGADGHPDGAGGGAPRLSRQ